MRARNRRLHRIQLDNKHADSLIFSIGIVILYLFTCWRYPLLKWMSSTLLLPRFFHCYTNKLKVDIIIFRGKIFSSIWLLFEVLSILFRLSQLWYKYKFLTSDLSMLLTFYFSNFAATRSSLWIGFPIVKKYSI